MSAQGASALRQAARRLLEVRNLKVTFRAETGTVRAVDDVSFSVNQGEVVAIVGESGSGKSVTVMTVMGLTRSPNAIIAGRAEFDGGDLLGASDRELRKVRGRDIGMVFQDPMTSLNPVYRVGSQIVEQIRAHDPSVSRKAARARAIDLMERVDIPNPRLRARAFPHELSGGMRQRVMIAMAISLSPRLLIADEPTTALDVTIQAQILDELRALREQRKTAIIFVTHDLGVVADIADRVIVMYGGRVVEEATIDQAFYNPQHPYTWGLLNSMPQIQGERQRRLQAIPGLPPSLANPPVGCHFRPRCAYAFDKCVETPELVSRVLEEPDHADRCWLTSDEKRRVRPVWMTTRAAARGAN